MTGQTLSFAELVLADRDVVVAQYAALNTQDWMKKCSEITDLLRARLVLLMATGIPGEQSYRYQFANIVDDFVHQAEDKMGQGYYTDRSVQEWNELDKFARNASRIKEKAKIGFIASTPVEKAMVKIIEMLKEARGPYAPTRFNQVVAYFKAQDSDEFDISEKILAEAFARLVHVQNIRYITSCEMPAIMYVPNPTLPLD
jgi:hypothetical protein